MDFYARVVLDAPYPGDEASVCKLVDGLIDGLEMYGGRVAATPSGRVGLSFTVPAQTLHEATSTALAVATAASHPEPLALEVSPTEEYARWSEDGTEPGQRRAQLRTTAD